VNRSDPGAAHMDPTGLRLSKRAGRRYMRVTHAPLPARPTGGLVSER
jgi:hypothetical protein